MPVADGIINAGMEDFYDFGHITGNLRASLCKDGGTWPDKCLSPLQ